MRTGGGRRTLAAGIVALLTAGAGVSRASAQMSPITLPLEGTSGLTLVRTHARAATYRGRKAVELTEARSSGDTVAGLEEVALLDRPEFGDGTIELWVAGTLAPGAAADARGFVGLVFRCSADASHFENFYLRPTNGRADDQLRRNHATQYASLPDYPWFRLRKEAPGKYESYADLVPGQWTHLRVVVSGERASLYVNDAAQPSLVVNDLKLGQARGKVGLWFGPGTIGYFSRMVVTAGGG
jgi:hypothetical protein